MKTVFQKMEFCAANATIGDESAFFEILALLDDSDWQVRYAAAIALGDRRDPRAVDGLIEALRRENEAPLFTQPALEGSAHAGSSTPYEVVFPAGTTEATKDAWRRRGRVLQAAILALGSIGTATPAVLELLHLYATDQNRDYGVRAASCKALGLLGQPESLPVLEKASGDQEFCTRCEAGKAVKKMKAHA